MVRVRFKYAHMLHKSRTASYLALDVFGMTGPCFSVTMSVTMQHQTRPRSCPSAGLLQSMEMDYMMIQFNVMSQLDFGN